MEILDVNTEADAIEAKITFTFANNGNAKAFRNALIHHSGRGMSRSTWLRLAPTHEPAVELNETIHRNRFGEFSLAFLISEARGYSYQSISVITITPKVRHTS